MKELGLVMSSRKPGVRKDMINGIVDGTFIMDGGYKVLNVDVIADILKKSM